MKRASPLFLVLSCLTFLVSMEALCVPAIAQPVSQETAYPATLRGMLEMPNLSFDGYAPNQQGLLSLYRLRQFEPIWDTKGGRKKTELTNLITTMGRFADDHGLDQSDFPKSLLAGLIESDKEIDAIKLEILITDWLIHTAHDMNGNQVNLSEIYVSWPFTKPSHNIIGELVSAIKEGKVQEYLLSLAPNDPEYTRLTEALAHYRQIKANGGWEPIPTGPTIKPMMSDARLEAVRARLSAESYLLPLPPSPDPTLYTDDLKSVVMDYQARNGLDVDGNIGSKTIATMNISVARRIAQIRANMERLRHMPRDYPERYIQVNVAAADVKLIEQGRVIYHAPVVLGRPDRKTPFIQSALRSIIFNPSWHVPARIARQDILPKLRKDPHYLEKMGFVLSRTDGEDGPIDWNEIKASEFAFRLRQTPGEMNSLGKIKFDFDNRFSVYMHGTPHEELFAKAERHLSSGCIRLKDPEQFAVFVLEGNEGDWTVEKVQGEIDKRKTHWMKVDEELPLYIFYQTVFTHPRDGSLQFRNDVYNYDRLLLDALHEKTNSL